QRDPTIRDPAERAGVASQQTMGAADDRVEHRLDIRLRLADDAQNVTGGSLLVERRGQVTVTRLEFLEQPHVFDRDHGLVGEGLEEGDVMSSEATSFAASHRYRPDGPVVTEHRHDHPASKATDRSEGSLAVSQPGIRVRISDIERRAVANGLG